LPAITYQRVSNRRLTSHEGSLGVLMPLVQLSCWAKTWSEARAVAAAVRRALDGWIDYSTDPPIHGVTVESDLDEYDSDARVYHGTLTVRVRAGEGCREGRIWNGKRPDSGGQGQPRGWLFRCPGG